MKGYFPSAFAFLFIFLVGCNTKQDDYATSPNGLKYRVVVDNQDKKAIPGEFIYYHVSWRTMNDSMLFNSRSTGEPFISLVARPLYEGDPWEVFTFLGPGDSAVLKLPAKLIYKAYLPKNLKPDDLMKMDLKVLDVLDKKGYDSARAAAITSQLGKEDQMLQTYMRKNNLAGTKTPAGIYVVIETEGKGPQAANGNTVRVHYTGKLLNGKLFDTSMEPGREPYEFTLGAATVIKGWDEGLTYFKKGGKGWLLIPSAAAYGDRGSPPNIGPNEPLVFEIEMVDIR